MSSRLFPTISLLLVVAAISAVVSLVIIRSSRPPDVADTQQFDAWLHKQLGITAEQERAMAADEEVFHQRQRELVAETRRLNGELSKAILEDKVHTTRIQGILGQIHFTQGQLQEISIRHIFEMEKHLTPEQYERLLRLTANALKPHGATESHP